MSGTVASNLPNLIILSLTFGQCCLVDLRMEVWEKKDILTIKPLIYLAQREPLMATTVVAPLPPAGCQPGCSLPLGNVLVLEQHQSANEVSLVARSYFNISLHWDCLQSRQVLFLHCLPVPPSKDAPSTLLHPFHSIDVAISRAPSAFSPHFDPTIQPPRGESRLTAEHSIPPPFNALLVNLCDLSVVIGVLHRRRWYQQQPIPVYFINTTWVVKKTNTNKNTRKKTPHVKYREFA